MAQGHKRAFVTLTSQADSSTLTAPELNRIQSEDRTVQVSPTVANWQDSTARWQGYSARTVHFSAAACRAYLRAAGDEGLHRAGVEFRSLAEDFDRATSTGKLQFPMVLVFSG